METKECVTLVPFVHQVGGHTGVMKYDEATVCKPVAPAELHFYETLPPEIAKFTPGFKGVVHVLVQEGEDGSLSVCAHPIRTQRQTSTTPLSPSTGRARISDSTCSQDRKRPLNCAQHRTTSKLKRTSCSRSWPFRRQDGRLKEDVFEDHSESKTMCHGYERGNPWGVHLNRLQLARMLREDGSAKFHKFILLENLTSQFHSPCILDMKLGTRTYHKNHSKEKRQLHIDRDAATTTATLGLRLCGMQVYQPSKGCYKCHNKYDGRRLAKDGLQGALCEFLSDGERIRTEFLSPFIEKLNALFRVVSTVTTVSFLSTSLLLMYEGNQASPCIQGTSGSDSPGLVVDLRMIDFANSERDPESITDIEANNQGCLYGLGNLVQILTNIQGLKSI